MNWCAADHSFPAKQVRGALELKGTKPARLARLARALTPLHVAWFTGVPVGVAGPAGGILDQYTTVNPPSGPANAATRLHAGTPSARPVAPSGSPLLSKTCQAIEPALPHFIPSAQATSVSPRELPATLGYLRPLASPGAAIGGDIRPVDGLMTP